MPVFDLYGAFILPELPSLHVTYDATLGEFGTPVAPVLAFTDGLDPDGNPYPPPDPLDNERVDVGSTFRVAGHDYVATRAWFASGGTERISDPGHPSGGIYIYEVTDGTTTLLLAFPNRAGLVTPDDLLSFTLQEPLVEVTGTSYNLIWPGYNYVDNGTPLPCFAAGTRIDCPGGPRPVEALRAGDGVRDSAGGLRRVVWSGLRVVAAGALAAWPQACPIRIEAGALGQGLPRRALLVSPQHRMLVASRVARRLAGAGEVLIAARHLAGLPGIARVAPAGGVRYHHVLLDRHAVLLAEGAPAESLLPGPQALAAYPPAQGLALAAAALGADPMPARPLVTGRMARAIVAAHGRHGRPLLADWGAALRAA